MKIKERTKVIDFWPTSLFEDSDPVWESLIKFNRYLDMKKLEILPNYSKMMAHKWGYFHGVKICKQCGVLDRPGIGSCSAIDKIEIEIRKPTLFSKIKNLFRK